MHIIPEGGELRRQPDHWFVALQAITRVNPIPSSRAGDVEAGGFSGGFFGALLAPLRYTGSAVRNCSCLSAGLAILLGGCGGFSAGMPSQRSHLSDHDSLILALAVGALTGIGAALVPVLGRMQVGEGASSHAQATQDVADRTSLSPSNEETKESEGIQPGSPGVRHNITER